MGKITVVFTEVFNFCFQKDYTKIYEFSNVNKKSKTILKTLNKYYNSKLCEYLNFNLSSIYDLNEKDINLLDHFFLIDTLYLRDSGIPFSDYEKK